MENNKNDYIRNGYLYDLDHRDNLIDDIPFYIGYAHNYSKHTLELGCGTGRVSIEIAKSGFLVTGIDLSKEMLKVFQEKIENLPKDIKSRIIIQQGNMTNFNFDNKYSLIIAPFRVFQALTKDTDIKNCLKCINTHLEDNGIFIINVFRPNKVLDDSWVSNENIIFEQEDPRTGNYVIKKDIREKIDTINQIIYPKFIYEIKDKNGNIETVIEKLELKYYYYDQLKKLLEENNFIVTEEYGWYDKSTIINGRELIMICKKKGSYSV